MSTIPCSWKWIILGVATLAVASTPASAQEIRWRTDYTSVRAEARQKNKPLFVDFASRGCVWCDRLDEITLRDPAIVALLNEHFIPMKVDVASEPWLPHALGIRSYPTMVVAASDGTILEKQAGYVDAAQLRQQLWQALTQARDKQSAGKQARTASTPAQPVLAGTPKARQAQ